MAQPSRKLAKTSWSNPINLCDSTASDSSTPTVLTTSPSAEPPTTKKRKHHPSSNENTRQVKKSKNNITHPSTSNDQGKLLNAQQPSHIRQLVLKAQKLALFDDYSSPSHDSESWALYCHRKRRYNKIDPAKLSADPRAKFLAKVAADDADCKEMGQKNASWWCKRWFETESEHGCWVWEENEETKRKLILGICAEEAAKKGMGMQYGGGAGIMASVKAGSV